MKVWGAIMAAARAIGAVAVGLLVAGAAYVIGGRRAASGPVQTERRSKTNNNAIWANALADALAYDHPDASFVFDTPYSGGENAATFDDVDGLMTQFGMKGGVRGLLDTIAIPESGGDYNIVYGGSKLRPAQPITTMTVAEVQAWQKASVRAGSASSAAGKYQVISGTLGDMVKTGVVSPNDRFDATTQDKIGLALADRRGLSDYQSGRIDAETFANNLAKEWAGLPVVSGPKAGRSYYAGDGLNNAGIGIDRILAAIKGVRA